MLKIKKLFIIFGLISLNQMIVGSDEPKPKTVVYPDNIDEVYDADDDLSDGEKELKRMGITGDDVSRLIDEPSEIESEALTRLRELMRVQRLSVAGQGRHDSPVLPVVPQNTPTAQAADKK